MKISYSVPSSPPLQVEQERTWMDPSESLKSTSSSDRIFFKSLPRVLTQDRPIGGGVTEVKGKTWREKKRSAAIMMETNQENNLNN